MAVSAFDKRIRFNALACNAGADCLEANAWYCSLSKRDRKESSIPDLIERYQATKAAERRALASTTPE